MPAEAGGATWRRVDVQVPDATIAAYRHGRGTPFYWCHGVTSSSLAEADLAFAPWWQLRDDWEIVLVDARGHGRSTGNNDPRRYLWSQFARDLLVVSDALGHDRLVVGGLSMGAAVALHAAVAAPDRVVGLVLMIPPTAWEQRSRQREEYRADAALARRGDIDALVAAEAARPRSPIFDGLVDASDAARRRFTAMAPATLAADLEGAAAYDLPAEPDVAALAQPALILAWVDDPGHPMTTTDRLTQLLPDASTSVARTLDEIVAWPAAVRAFCERLHDGHGDRPLRRS